MDELINKIKSLGREGLFHIFGSSLLSNLGGLISSVIVIRKLEKVAYGSFVDADNLYSYLSIFIGLGLTSAIIQYCSEPIAENRKGAIYRYSLKAGTMGNIFLCLLIFALAALKRNAGEITVANYLVMMCGLPFITYINQYFQIILRVKLNNRAFSYANMLYTLTHVAGNIILTLIWGVPGLIASQYFAHGVAAVKGALELKKDGFFASLAVTTERLHRHEQKEYISYAMICTLSNFTSKVLTLLDVTCIGLVLSDPAILADYKVASTIPSACAFIPSCLMTFFYPKLVMAFSNSTDAGKSQIKQQAKVYAVINGAAYICLALFAPLIILILFGEKYMNVIPVFEILSLNYLVYCIRNLTGNVLAIIKKVKINLLFSTLSGLLNVCLNLLLIPVLGSMGAAVATLIVTAFISLLNIGYLWRFLKK